MAKRTRQEMEEMIDRGESVYHRGRIVSDRDHLPEEAELAKGDPEREKAAVDAIDAQIAALQAARDNLGKLPPAAEEAPAEKGHEAKGHEAKGHPASRAVDRK